MGPATIDGCHERTKKKRCQERCEGDDFIMHIITGDESWVLHYDPENKRQSMEYPHPDCPPGRKLKSSICAESNVYHFLGCKQSYSYRMSTDKIND